MPVRHAHAVWEGTLKRGQGRMRTGSGACEASYSAATRFEEAPGSNPDELLGAAHAGCFSMALSLSLEQAGYPPERIETDARVHIDKQDGGFAITRIDLSTRVRANGIPEELFQQQAEAAKQGCPVSRALASTPITLQAQLEREPEAVL